ncbi:MAG TPA: glycosyltransferase family 2 protein [Feifaniaceae bacterium]|nr:glycosyltransferase family 2 protein [Feifaniaceae bacterium]
MIYYILIELFLALAGLLMTFVLFYRFPKLPRGTSLPSVLRVSVVIPSRNEEENLPHLLSALRNQTFLPFEILVVDDASQDQTAEIARSFGAVVLTPPEKPEGWVGKSWACQFGADRAGGDLLLFLDADVNLAPDGISRLIAVYEQGGSAISVQPFHLPKRAYEQFSLFFNLVQIGANGSALRRPISLGLYGPVVLIPREQYASIGGHTRIRNNILEDMALGELLRKNGVPYRLFIGDSGLSFRMYPEGLNSLLQGWTKNLAAGAAKTPFPLFMPVFLWIMSAVSVPLHLVLFALMAERFGMIAFGTLYCIWVTVLCFLSRRVGRFSPLAIALFPVPMAVFLAVFVVSVFKRLFGWNVMWKGRAIRPDR